MHASNNKDTFANLPKSPPSKQSTTLLSRARLPLTVHFYFPHLLSSFLPIRCRLLADPAQLCVCSGRRISYTNDEYMNINRTYMHAYDYTVHAHQHAPAHAHTRAHTHKHAHTHTYTHTHTCTYTHMCAHVCTYTHTYTCIHTLSHTHDAHTHARTHIHTHTTHTHIPTHIQITHTSTSTHAHKIHIHTPCCRILLWNIMFSSSRAQRPPPSASIGFNL